MQIGLKHMEVKVVESPTTEDLEILATEMYERGLYVSRILKKGDLTFIYFSTQVSED